MLKNKFVLILLISGITLGALIVGAMTLYKHEPTLFSSDGYIIDTTTEAIKKYYFSANTEYKDNVENKIVFSDVDNNKVTIDPASFVHYSNGDIAFLKKGALVNLTELNSNMINYYNITSESTIKYEEGNYIVSANNNDIKLESFIGRISDSKYIISGKDLTLKIPQNQEPITGDYFEILFIEDGIVKIDNEKASYQVTAQDTYIKVGNNITINLGTGKIFYDNDVKMLISQITINNDENINLDVDEKSNSSAGGGGGGGSGSGTGDGDGDGEGTGDGIGGEGSGEDSGEGSGEGSGDGSGEGSGDGSGDGTGSGGAGSGNGTEGTGSGGAGEGGNGTGTGEGTAVTASLQVELIEAIVTATTIDLSLQLNNATLVEGNLLYYFTNLSTGQREGNSKYIDLVNGTFLISQESLSPSTDYSFTVIETNGGKEKQYFQKTFKTKDLGISLEKTYATDSSLSYKVNFTENSEVTKARVSICEEVTDKKGNVSCKESNKNQIEVSNSELGKEVVFENLKSNTTYAVSVDMIWINNAAYSGVYTINRLDTTLKKTPKISGIQVDTNSEEVKFTIKLNNVSDPDKSIEKYIYNIYLADDITIENLNPTVQYTVVKNDTDDLVLNLNEIAELKTGVDYRCKIIAQYNDNEMVREVSTDYSINFLIKSKPNISFITESATMNKVVGTLSLIDSNCTVPFTGRTCANMKNNFTLRYYKLTEDENNLNDTNITFKNDLTTKLTFENLESNTTYAVKLFGDYYDDNNIIHEHVQLGDTFYITTDKSDNVYFEVTGDNQSGKDENGNVVTFDARLTAPQDSNVINEIATITLNLYSGRYNHKDKLIGNYTITEKSLIEDFFNNLTITNSLFNDTTGKVGGKIDSLEKLITATNNITKTLNSDYTVEVEDVYDSTGKNKITVENNVYTFHLTPTYYLDSRIETNPKEKYVTVTPITKEELRGTSEEPSEEYTKLSKTVKELDSLSNDTIVGLTIENSLSDIFVDSAFTYEKVIVDYIIYNATTNKTVKTISIDMGNKYQPKEQIIYLDSTELDDGNKHFTRGYKYKVGFNLNFITEDGENPTYTNKALHKTISIERQNPIYTQYISTSNDKGITYKYSFTDIDDAIEGKNFYYTLGNEITEYKSIKDTLKKDGKYHEVTIPITTNNNYKLYYLTKDTDNKNKYIEISNYIFEKEYKYDNSISYEIINDNSNVLKLKFENNDYNNRAYAYEVIIKANGVDTYTKYFLASKLKTLTKTETTPSGEEVNNEYKYIGIDYANIVDFMGKEITITVNCYYDSGKVGFNQTIDYGMVLKNNQTNKYLNTYYQGNGKTPTSSSDEASMGIYNMKDKFIEGSTNMFVYNRLAYIPSTSFDGSSDVLGNGASVDNHGINYNLDYTDKGIVFTNGNIKYEGYNLRVLNKTTLNTNNNTYKFETIIPSISIKSTNTINSINLQIIPSGIYGQEQFTDKKIEVTFYSDSELTNKLKTITSSVTINQTTTGYTATISPIKYENLTPATTYYYTVSANIKGEEVRLFDTELTTKNNKYTYVDYETSTLNSKDILKRINFSVQPTAYTTDGDYPQNTLSWQLNLASTSNYRLRFELYRPDGTITEIDPNTKEEQTITQYKAVNFDGTDASSCNKDSYGNSTNGYVKNCYINVEKDNVKNISTKTNKYTFTNTFDETTDSTGKGFMYGGNYYKLIVYAVPYTNNAYDENNRLVLYEKENLSTTGNITESNGISYNITIPNLEEVTFDLKNTLKAGHSTDDNTGYYISFTPTVTDKSYIAKKGVYYATLKDQDGNIVGQKQTISITTKNKEIKFTKLKSNTLYYVELSYEAYRNNIGLSIPEKISTSQFTDFTYTPIAQDITLGTITAKQDNQKKITLTYNGASSLNNIDAIAYTISLKGGSSKVTGKYILKENHPLGDKNTDSIFTIASDGIPRLTIDVSNTTYSNNNGFSFKDGNTYIITTQYYYEGNLLEDQETGNSTYTTILNL